MKVDMERLRAAVQDAKNEREPFPRGPTYVEALAEDGPAILELIEAAVGLMRMLRESRGSRPSRGLRETARGDVDVREPSRATPREEVIADARQVPGRNDQDCGDVTGGGEAELSAEGIKPRSFASGVSAVASPPEPASEPDSPDDVCVCGHKRSEHATGFVGARRFPCPFWLSVPDQEGE